MRSIIGDRLWGTFMYMGLAVVIEKGIRKGYGFFLAIF